MMHILFVTGEFPPQQGGVGAYTAELGKALIEQGHRVSVVTSRSVNMDATDAHDEIFVYNIVESWNWHVWGEIGRLASEIDDTLASFIRGMGTVCLILGTYYAVALMAVGLQFGLVVGFEQMKPGAIGTVFDDRPSPFDRFDATCRELAAALREAR